MVVGDQGGNGRPARMVVVMHRFFRANGDGDGEPAMVSRLALAWDDGDAVRARRVTYLGEGAAA